MKETVWIIKTTYTNGNVEINGVFKNRYKSNQMKEFIIENSRMFNLIVEKSELIEYYII